MDPRGWLLRFALANSLPVTTKKNPGAPLHRDFGALPVKWPTKFALGNRDTEEGK